MINYKNITNSKMNSIKKNLDGAFPSAALEGPLATGLLDDLCRRGYCRMLRLRPSKVSSTSPVITLVPFLSKRMDNLTLCLFTAIK